MHFQSKLHNNSILTGAVDSYCLVCDNYLRSEDEAFTHTEKPIHKKNMGAAARVEKFLEDRIIKVKKGYYCPFCNILLSTITKVSIHVADANHQENKGAQMLSRIGDNIIAFDEVAITLISWHGLMDDTCVICNTEFDNTDIHKSDHSHILKLVQSKCEFGSKYVYRKVDEDSFFCLICGSAFSVNEKSNHHENITHKNLYNSGKELKSKVPPQTLKTTPKPEPTSNEVPKKPVDEKNTEKIDKKKMVHKKTENVNAVKAKPEEDPLDIISDSILLPDGKFKAPVSSDKEMITLFGNAVIAKIAEQEQKKPKPVINDKSEKEPNKISDMQTSDILDRVDEFQKKGVNIDFTWERARCTLCNVYLPFDASAIQGHIEKQHNIKKTTDPIQPNLILKKEANITHTNDGKIDTKKLPSVVSPKTLESTNNERVDAGNTPKVDSKKPAKKVDNSVVLLKHTQLTEDQVESRADTKLKPKANAKEAENGVAPKPDSKKVNNTEPKTNSHKTENVEPKAQTNAKSTNKVDTKKQTKPDNKPKVDTKKELEMFAKENNIVIMPNEAYCPQCQVNMTLSIAAMHAHANLDSHKNNKSSNGMTGKKMSETVETFIRLESNLGSDVVLNNKYVLRQHSFHFIVMEDEGYKCMLCDADFRKSGEQLVQHMNGPDHKNKMALCKVMTSLPEEFIREITPDVYHCGYCNEVFDGATEMIDHLSRSRHVYARQHARWSLERCHSVTRNTRLMQISSILAINYT